MRKGAIVLNPTTAQVPPDLAARPRVPGRRPSVTSLGWAVPAVLTAALGLFDINVPMVWRDELATWSAASRTLPQLWAMLHTTDAILGLYYLGIHLWMAAFGDSATAMRLPSALAMTGATAVVALIGRRIGGPNVGLIGGLIFAVIPSVSRYAQEARPYAFATLFAALCVLADHAIIVGSDFCLRTVRIGGDASDDGRALPGGRPEPVEGQPLALLGRFSYPRSSG